MSDFLHISITDAPLVVVPDVVHSAGNLSSGQSHVVTRFVVAVVAAVVPPCQLFLEVEPVAMPLSMLNLAPQAIGVVDYCQRFRISISLVAYHPVFAQNCNVPKVVVTQPRK